MKLHLLTKLFSVIAFIYLASSGQCQEKAKEDTLTASQKKEVLKANLIYKEMLGKYQKNEFANATPLAIQALKIYRELLGTKHSKTANTIIDLGRLYLYQKEYAKSEPLCGHRHGRLPALHCYRLPFLGRFCPARNRHNTFYLSVLLSASSRWGYNVFLLSKTVEQNLCQRHCRPGVPTVTTG